MIEFAYNNVKNSSFGYTLFKLNYSYHLYMFYKKNFNFNFKSKLADKLLIDIKELISVYKKNLYYA